MPHVASNYAVEPDEWTLTGASLGGLFTVYAQLMAATAFRRFNAVSPSLWWDNGWAFAQAKKFLAEPSTVDAAIYLSAGEFESAESLAALKQTMPPDLLAVFRDCFECRGTALDMPIDAHEVASMLRQKAGLQVNVKTMPGESHTSVMGVAQSHGLRWLHKVTNRGQGSSS
ncbi:MAG: alpha/beta hydrolase-fold protein [Haliea sp.]|uniref:alpha/beta hydrolase n=2 Tax=Gammaproteobacteria TaxID=1236 RepID=UPI0032EE8106